ncbi:Gfo/Idh/MocA family oxidoreductase [Terrarubrum flagellatum]|uniref:Gfo/Idh/MocA family protein n=1 Tax=Terrirubrum flagellatum TaxID=2895980 RepID=UPI003144F387
MTDLSVGVVGCGVISATYLDYMPSFAGVKIVACTDIIPERSAEKAAKHGIDAVTPEEMMKRDDVHIILNITPPQAHFEVDQAALSAGKHVFSEKPLCVEPDHGPRLVSEAQKRGLTIGCAPDTFLGAGGRLAREIVDSGKIGRVVAGSCNLMSRGMEHWHPDPRAFYQRGGGPLFDVGPYYLNALINLLGPIESVVGLTSSAFPSRHVTADGPLKGQHIPVGTPTTLMGVLRFACGADINLFMSWDVWKHGHPPIELYGTEGSLRVPDPNFFGGAVEYSERNGDWIAVDSGDRAFGRPNYRSASWPASAPMRANYRCLGVAELASAVQNGTPHRASLALGAHAVEAMHAVLASGADGGAVRLRSAIARPAALDETSAAALWAGGWR